MKVGMIGLGSMGMAFCKSLIGKGYQVFGYDSNARRNQELEQIGGHPCGSCAEVGSHADAVVLLVFDANNVRSVLYGEQSLLSTLPKGKSVLVSCSVGHEVVEEIAPDLKQRGIQLIDAPLMGSSEDAENGSIHIMVAAAQEDLAEVEPLLRDMGSELYVVSDQPGRGQAAKSCVQALFSLTFQTGFEVVTLAQNAGLDMDQMHRLFKNGPSSSVLFHITEDSVRNRTFTNTNNPLSILDKDMQLVVDMAEEYQLNLKASRSTAQVFLEAMSRYPQEDIFAAVKVVEKQ